MFDFLSAGTIAAGIAYLITRKQGGLLRGIVAYIVAMILVFAWAVASAAFLEWDGSTMSYMQSAGVGGIMNGALLGPLVGLWAARRRRRLTDTGSLPNSAAAGR